MTVKCIDISHWQKGFNMGGFAAQGGLAAIFKATEGTHYKDDQYKNFKQQAKDNGIISCSYHYFSPSDDPVEQAHYYYNFVQPAAGERVVCDYEASGCTIANMIVFLQELQRIDKSLQLTVYAGGYLKSQLGNGHNSWLAENTSLWIAHYTTAPAPSWPSGTWPVWSLWQYSQSGKIPPFSGDVDCDRFNGSDDALIRWIGPTKQLDPVQPPAPLPITHPVVSVNITTPLGVDVKISVNGKDLPVLIYT